MARLVLETGGGAEAKRVLDEIRQKLQGVSGATEVLEKAQSKLDRQNRTIQRQFDSLAKSLDPVIKREKDLERATRTLDRAFKAGIVTQAEYNRLLGLAQTRFSGVTNAAQGASIRMPSYIATAFSVAGIVRFGQSILDAELKLVGFQKRLTVAFGGNEQAGAQGYKFAVAESKRLGLALENVAEGYSRIAVAGSAAGFSQKQDEEIFSSVAEAAAALSLSGSDTERVLIAVEQMMSKGKVSAEELRRQMGNALPGAFQLAAKAMGMSTMELDKLVSTGQIMALDFLPKFAQELHKTFGPEAEKNIGLITGAVNNLKTAWFELKTAIAEAGVGAAVQAGANQAASAANDFAGGLKSADAAAKAVGFQNLYQALTLGLRLMIAPGSLMNVNKAAANTHKALRGVGLESGPAPGAVDTSGVVPPPKDTMEVANFRTELAKMRGEVESTAKAQAAAVASGAQDDWVNSIIKQGKEAEETSKKLAELKKKVDDIFRSAPGQREAEMAQGILGGADSTQLKSDMQRALELTQAVRTEQERRNQNIAEAVRLQKEGLITQETLQRVINQNADTFAAIADESAKITEEWQKFRDQIQENFLRGVQSAMSDFFYGILSGTGNVFQQFARSLKEVLFRTLAEYLAQWAITQAKMLALSLKRIAAEKAAEGSGGGGGVGGSVGKFGSLGKLWSSYKGAGGSAGGIAGAAAVGAIIAYGIWSQKQAKANMLKHEVVGGGYYRSGTGVFGGSDETSQKIQETLRSWIDAIKQGTGQALDELKQFSVEIMGDGRFRATFEGVTLGVFKDWNQAAVEAFRTAFNESGVADKLSPIMQEVLNSSLSQVMNGADASIISDNLKYVQQIMREASGLSDVSAALQDLPNKIREVRDKLIEMGSSANEAFKLSSQWGIQKFTELRRDITGEKETPAQVLARKKAEATLFNAQLAMFKAELVARKAFLEARLSGVRAGIRINQAEIEGAKAHLDARKRTVQVDNAITQAELDAINESLKVIDSLKIDVNSIKIGGGGGGGGMKGLNSKMSAVKAVLEEIRDLQKDLLTSTLNPGGLNARFSAAQAEFYRLKNLIDTGHVKDAAGISDAVKQYLELYGQLYGTAGSGYADVFKQITDWLAGVTGANDNHDKSVPIKRSGTDQSPFSIRSRHLEKAGSDTVANGAKSNQLLQQIATAIGKLNSNVASNAATSPSFSRTKSVNAIPGAA